jgi:1-aminocyclopropane-1-carboxylate deaminase/D-cysteine desulfhydrase-like pyridoxal-dependent ACC family enzyme
LAVLPTPLEACPRLSAALGGPDIFIKRDDLTGLAFGGNKTRQLEFVFAEVLASGADTVVAGAYTQSNWCRQITAAACKLGLRPVLLLARGVKGDLLQGNLLLDRLMGAEIEILDVLDEELQPFLEAKAKALMAAGRRPYLISSFMVETQSLAAIGYVQAVIETLEQLAALGRHADWFYVAGAEMSPAGLIVGTKSLGCGTSVVSISPVRYAESRESEISRICNATAGRLGLKMNFTREDVASDEGYIGDRYGIVTQAGLDALRLVARTEGIVLDPVYTAKAMSGLIDHIRSGRIGRGQTVVFFHTGGLPALFAYAGDLGLA